MQKLSLTLITVISLSFSSAYAAKFPGTSIDDPNSFGRVINSKALLEKGAHLVSGISDKLHELGLQKEFKLIKGLQDSGMDVAIVGDVVTVSIPSVLFFTPGSTQIQESQKPALALLAKFVKAGARTVTSLHGYSSDLGSKEYQQDYAYDTAKAIEAALWVNGIALSDMRVHGHGSENAVSKRADSLYNARVEVRIQT